ncbi:hypothetical protein BJY00DRAFT_305322 [Aspergillus carlsbadensis]|nr:hypothetical protein BJY00DRAFT_305322 [Aspergillus carlsbadensis]
MPSNKDRLYVALYARGGQARMPGKEDTYHWAFIIGPKVEPQGGTGVRYHAKERPTLGGGSERYFEQLECTLAQTSMLLVRVVIAKVMDRSRVADIFRSTPIRQGQPGWNCVSGDSRALGTNVTDWAKVRNQAMAYCQQKKDQHRFDGRGNFDMGKVPTFDLMEMKEIVV